MKISSNIIQPVRYMSVPLDAIARATYVFVARGVRQMFLLALPSCKTPWFSWRNTNISAQECLDNLCYRCSRVLSPPYRPRLSIGSPGGFAEVPRFSELVASQYLNE